jgi:hypothetical protein
MGMLLPLRNKVDRSVLIASIIAVTVPVHLARADEPSPIVSPDAPVVSAPVGEATPKVFPSELATLREAIQVQGYRIAQLESARVREREGPGPASHFVEASFITPCFATIGSGYPLTSAGEAPDTDLLVGSVGLLSVTRNTPENVPGAVGFVPSFDISVGSAVTVGGKLLAQYGQFNSASSLRSSTRLGAELRVGRRYVIARSVAFWPKLAVFASDNDVNRNAKVYGGRFDAGFVFPLSELLYAEAAPSIAVGVGTRRGGTSSNDDVVPSISLSASFAFGLYL